MKKGKVALFISPHTDDCELGCGGTIARLCEEGSEVFYAAFSAAEESVPPGFPGDSLRKEVVEATGVLGVSPGNVRVYGYRVRHFYQYRQEILEDLLRLRSEIRPDLIVIPTPANLHQDHEVVAKEGIRAFKHESILGYEQPWNNLTFHPVFFMTLAGGQVNKKLRALDCYRTQKERRYFDGEFIRSLARVRGTQAGVAFAEAFEVIKWVSS